MSNEEDKALSLKELFKMHIELTRYVCEKLGYLEEGVKDINVKLERLDDINVKLHSEDGFF